MNNSRVRNRVMLQSVKSPVKHEKEKVEMQGTKTKDSLRPVRNRLLLSRETKKALQQDVDKLKKKLRLEENIHRALERAFNRPLGVLPRLPPYLPPATLELLAEVAVLEEEVIRLEEQVVHFRQDLYQEAVYISSSKRNMESAADLYEISPNKNSKPDQCKSLARNSGESATITAKNLPSLSEDVRAKANKLQTSYINNNKEVSTNKAQTRRSPAKIAPVDNRPVVKHLDYQKSQKECKSDENVAMRSVVTSDERASGDSSPNKVSEDIVKCLTSIFLRMSSTKNRRTADNLTLPPALASLEHDEQSAWHDPYGICTGFGNRDIGPYKHLFAIEAGTININRTSNSLFLLRRLKLLLAKLATVKLTNLSHQEKLAFWINIYNSCMMNSYLEHGIPESPEMVVALMQKATVNVGGHLLDAVTIEHFILRLPYHSKYILSKGAKNDEKSARNKFGLELSEPLVTFALSCGSWSSPAVRVYTAAQVENELEVAKRDYLQAAVGITRSKFAIPKLLDWYLLDFAKDMESLLDWICIQLPGDLGKEAMACLERGKSEPHSQFIQIMPYEFNFRYLLCTS